MLGSMVHSLVIFHAIAFVIAAGTGIAIRARRARDDKQFRELNFND